MIDLAVLITAPFVGSFLGTVILRLPHGQPVVSGRSTCDSCGKILKWFELIPLLSWTLQRGRCRHCGARLGWFYPAIELAALAAAVWAAAVTSGWLTILSVVIGWWLLALAVIDWRHFLLPDLLTLPLIPMGLGAVYFLGHQSVLDAILSTVIGLAVFCAIAAAYRKLRGREGLGFGDAKLAAGAGAWLGWYGLPSMLLIASFTALVWALAAGRHQGTMDWQAKVSFGSFLCLGFWLTWLHGPFGFPIG
ncbi:MAG: A24 family peptidase [Minwuiales bacterium]|nr:A24 family peptidase [Minwuiales bacterium]